MSKVIERRTLDAFNEYCELYDKCWDGKPENRHSIESVYEVLEVLLNDDYRK